MKKIVKFKKWMKRVLWLLVFLFVMMNVLAVFHSYKFTHFSAIKKAKITDITRMTFGEKLNTMIFGINIPRPVNGFLPQREFVVVRLQSNKKIECWYMKTQNSKGTIILFHGYGGEKSGLLQKAMIFEGLGYNTVVVDFMGSGGSEGNQSTIGFLEAKQVKTCFDYFSNNSNSTCVLFGTSMGAVAIMKAISDYGIKPFGVILECPFGTMYKTVCARFKMMNVPAFPLAGLFVFWGGVQNGFFAFNHNPETYALQINCPTLLMYGAKDQKVSRSEINTIFKNLKGSKVLRVYELAGHENYLNSYSQEWSLDVKYFLQNKSLKK